MKATRAPIVPLKMEIERALALLEQAGCPRAARRLRAASRKILSKNPKASAPRNRAESTRPKTVRGRLVGGDGRRYEVIKLNVAKMEIETDGEVKE